MALLARVRALNPEGAARALREAAGAAGLDLR